MKKLLKTGSVVMFLVAGCVGFTACSDDNNEPDVFVNPTPGEVNPSNVFKGQMPKSVAGTQIIHNSKGLVTEIKTSDGKTVTFEYPSNTRAEESQNKVMMKIVEDGNVTEYVMTIGENGFVSDAYYKYMPSYGNHEYEEGDWSFKYDAEGHLTYGYYDHVDEQGSDTYSVTIKWENGNIVNTFKDDGWDNYTHLYTSATQKTAIENKGALFMFESIYPVEIYDFEWVYYAGMLGRGPKNLAVASYEDSDSDELSEYEWTLDANGYPVKFKEKDDDLDENDPNSSVLKFSW